VVVGAILTQSVAWRNVEKAIANLKGKGLLSVRGLQEASVTELEEAIVPTLYYRMKARKLKAFMEHLVTAYDGSLENMFSRPLSSLRPEVLSLYGIGPETADSILLYAGSYPVFVVDAYTRRIFSRLGFVSETATYEDMQRFFMTHLPAEIQLYNEYHAQIVALGNQVCLGRKPKCFACPLAGDCPAGGSPAGDSPDLLPAGTESPGE
jgi:endonuclease-3 related protein